MKLGVAASASVSTRSMGAAVAVAAILLAPGCDSVTGPNNNLVSLTNADDGRTIAVLVRDEIDITLQTIGPGEYGTPALSSGSVRFLGESSPGPQNPGGVRQLFRFEAVTAGRAVITIPHMDGFPLPRAPFAIAVEVH